MTLKNHINNLTIACFVVLFVWGGCMVVSDIYAPFTTNAYVDKKAVYVATEVNGTVDHVYVKNGDYVKKGDPLFSISSDDLQTNYDTAYANLVVMQQSIEKLKLEIEIDKKTINEKTVSTRNEKLHLDRMESMRKKQAISEEEVEDARTTYNSEVNELRKSKLELKVHLQKLSNVKGENGALLLAEALLKKEKIRLEKAVTYASISGWISNLQLGVGDTASNRSTQVAIVKDNSAELIANFNEKALSNLDNAHVLIVFDAIPGEIFDGKVTSIDAGVRSQDITESGEGALANVNQGDRWVRRSQYVRSTIHFDEQNKLIVSGSRATVMVERTDSTLWLYFSHAVMKVMSWFRYIY